jgi:hypothetical protein
LPFSENAKAYNLLGPNRHGNHAKQILSKLPP